MWCKLDDLAFYKKGPFGSSLTKAMFVPKGKDTYKVYEQKNAIQKDHKLGSYYISTEKYCSLSGFAVHPYDIIVSCAGTIGETYVLPQNIQEGIINQALMLIRLYNREIERFYLLYFDFILKQEAYKESKGTAIKNIPPFDVLKNFFIPIPPKEEQKRILSEVDKWMSFVDDIDTNCKDLQLYIKHTKSKILDLAIHGKLVPQDPNDEPAIELLKRINPDFTPCDNGYYEQINGQAVQIECDYDFPYSWSLVRLSSICSLIDGEKKEGQQLCLDAKFLRGKSAGEYQQRGKFVHKGDNIILVDGENSGEVFTVPCDGYMGSTFKQLWVSSIMHLPYVLNYILFYKELLRKSKRGAAIPHLNKEIFYSLIIGIPPYQEQMRIVNRINEIYSKIKG